MNSTPSTGDVKVFVLMLPVLAEKAASFLLAFAGGIHLPVLVGATQSCGNT